MLVIYFSNVHNDLLVKADEGRFGSMNLTNDKSKNMKRLIMLFLVVTMMAAVLLVAGCTSRDEDLVGRWVFEEDATWVTTFNEDGTGTHSQSWGFGTSFEWTTPGNNIRWSYTGHQDMETPYNISNDALYITMEDGTVFRYLRD